MFINDSAKPDFRITWKDKQIQKTANSLVYTYGASHLLAVAAFKVLKPNVEILRIDRL